MKGTKSAGRYALALIELASEQNKLEQVKQDMELISATIAENHGLELLLQSPIIKVDKKQAVLKAVFGAHVQDMTMGFVALVCAKGREALLPVVVNAYIAIYQERMGIVTADVTSAVALTDAQRKEVADVLASLSEKIELIEHIDPKILGGLKVRIGDQRIDASYRKKLNELKYDIHNA
ncbi:MAG: ATP synthase F1 subunit delta [Cryomorphaceae bacterium]